MPNHSRKLKIIAKQFGGFVWAIAKKETLKNLCAFRHMVLVSPAQIKSSPVYPKNCTPFSGDVMMSTNALCLKDLGSTIIIFF